jgi:hypothetical protein
MPEAPRDYGFREVLWSVTPYERCDAGPRIVWSSFGEGYTITLLMRDSEWVCKLPLSLKFPQNVDTLPLSAVFHGHFRHIYRVMSTYLDYIALQHPYHIQVTLA